MSKNELKVHPGDLVWDTNLGVGKVISDEGFLGFTVRFPGDQIVTYSEGGYYNNIRRVYYQEPIIIEPIGSNDLVFKALKEVLPTLEKAILQVITSSGVGNLGPEYAKEVQERLQNNNNATLPSSRCRGCGGW